VAFPTYFPTLPFRIGLSMASRDRSSFSPELVERGGAMAEYPKRIRIYDPERRTHNVQQFAIERRCSPRETEKVSIAIKGVERLADGDVRFEVFCFERSSYEHLLASDILRCVNLKTGRQIRDLGRRYTVNRMK
jgi:hypothetical protein